MEKQKKSKVKARLGDKNDTKTQQALQEYALYYHKDIVSILDMIKRELLLVMKTNNYLRAIDRRLGNPNNTFNVVNNVTWSVYRKEIGSKMSTWAYLRETLKYYIVRGALFAMYIGLKCRIMLGLQVDNEELEDFDLYVTHHSGDGLEV